MEGPIKSLFLVKICCGLPKANTSYSNSNSHKPVLPYINPMAVKTPISKFIPSSHEIMPFYYHGFTKVISKAFVGRPICIKINLNVSLGKNIYTFECRIYGTVVRRWSHNDWFEDNIFNSFFVCPAYEQKVRQGLSPIFTRYVTPATEGESSIIGLQVTHLIKLCVFNQ